MSTKIYGAFKYKGSMAQLMPTLHKLRDKRKQEVFTNLANQVMNREDGGDENASKTVKDIVQKAMAEGGWGNFDIVSSMVVFFDTDPNKKRTETITALLDDGKEQNPDVYVQLFGCNTIEKELENDPLFDDFHYQNQSDPYWEYSDEEYTDKEIEEFEEDYENRCEVWDRIFKEYSYSTEAGLVFNIFDKDSSLFSLMWYVDKEVTKIKEIRKVT